MHDPVMTDRHPLADPDRVLLVHVHDDMILKVRLVADLDRSELGPGDHSEHHDRHRSDRDPSVYLRVWSDERRRIDARFW